MYLPETLPTPINPGENTRAVRSVGEAQLARAIASWFDGEPWSLQDAKWVPAKGAEVHLREEGDRLLHRGELIATRNPPEVHPGRNTAALGYARAVCRVVLRGDHLTLYRAS